MNGYSNSLESHRFVMALIAGGDQACEACSLLTNVKDSKSADYIRELRIKAIAPWILHQLKQLGELSRCPWWMQRFLEEENSYWKRRTAIQRLSLLQVSKLLDQEGIRFVVLKGADLAWTHYSLPYLRPMRDIDLLFQEEDLLNACDVLSSAGFTPLQKHYKDPGFWTSAYLAKDCLLCSKNDLSVHFELHRALWFNPELPEINDISMRNNFWEPGQNYMSVRPHFQVLSPTYSLLHCMIHHIANHSLNVGPLGLIDLQYLVDADGVDRKLILQESSLIGFPGLLMTTEKLINSLHQTNWLTESVLPTWSYLLWMGQHQMNLERARRSSFPRKIKAFVSIQKNGGRWCSTTQLSRWRKLVNIISATTILIGMGYRLCRRFLRRLTVTSRSSQSIQSHSPVMAEPFLRASVAGLIKSLSEKV
jgi:hypothetical protein